MTSAGTEPPSWIRGERFCGCTWGKWVIRLQLFHGVVTNGRLRKGHVQIPDTKFAGGQLRPFRSARWSVITEGKHLQTLRPELSATMPLAKPDSWFRIRGFHLLSPTVTVLP